MKSIDNLLKAAQEAADKDASAEKEFSVEIIKTIQRLQPQDHRNCLATGIKLFIMLMICGGASPFQMEAFCRNSITEGVEITLEGIAKQLKEKKKP